MVIASLQHLTRTSIPVHEHNYRLGAMQTSSGQIFPVKVDSKKTSFGYERPFALNSMPRLHHGDRFHIWQGDVER